MTKRNVKKTVALASCILCLGSTCSIISFASDDNKGYSFSLPGGYRNVSTGTEYRQTTSTSNPWKVNMAYNEEGDGCIATYWLASKYWDVVSGIYNVAQGTGAHYYTAYSTASQRDVRLSAENNNNTFWSYDVSGTWDEETW